MKGEDITLAKSSVGIGWILQTNRTDYKKCFECGKPTKEIYWCDCRDKFFCKTCVTKSKVYLPSEHQIWLIIHIQKRDVEKKEED